MSTVPIFRRMGEGSYVQPGGIVEGEDYIALGRQVLIQAPYWLMADPGPEATGDSPPVLMITDGCKCSSGLTIDASHSVTLERQVLIGSNVYLTDKIPYEVKDDPFLMGYETRASGRLLIGEGTLIDAGVVVEGNLRIGKGCVVRPNSVVHSDIPDYCVASGNPARVTEVFMPSAGEWVSASDEAEAEELLAQRRNQPLLSICIPTYNRASNLDTCLQSIFSQIGDCPLIEVDVSDNASTDDTPHVVERYMEDYSNLRYSRNDSNLGADRNILSVTDHARGIFIKLQGDDDFFIDHSLLPLLSILQKHADCGVVHINVLNGDGRVYRGEGAASYLETIGYAATFITSTILRREDWHQVGEKTLFNGSSLNQFYFQFAVLSAINPKYVIVNSSMFTYASNEPREYNFGEVFVRSYLKVLNHFIGNGLTEEVIRLDKHRLLHSYLIPWYQRIRRFYDKEITAGFEEIFTENFAEEAYYQYAIDWFRSVE
ncbi:glycosyltransferase [Paenibacillus albidus]|uniref:glycosyltransferase n=1 Tax=Paenibacillus albidus TaxID=2041023 RepID=UPI001BEA9AC1|nr:glycosyltransferase [Paenibacillus albidus]MBT2287731.1 glycosyltransferase [Paenibacillus albidus]